MNRLLAGVRRFRREVYPTRREVYEEAARTPQRPQALFITCADSRSLDNPFNNSVHDVALTSICRTIEINLRQYLGETELPAAVEPVHGVLW